jgi:hypothetical protein
MQYILNEQKLLEKCLKIFNSSMNHGLIFTIDLIIKTF